MPELPEVETTRQGLLPLIGRHVQGVTVRHVGLRWPVPADLAQRVTGQRLHDIARRAKYLLLRLDDGTVLLHLGMSGRLRLLEGAESPGKHDHVDIVFDAGQVLRLHDPRRFGAVLWLEGDPLQHGLLKTLGPEPLSADFDAAHLYRNTRTRSASIKQVLMDAHLVVGVGNIYASESLFRARINPKIPANTLSRARCARLTQEIKATLQDALAAGGSSLRDFLGTAGQSGYFQLECGVYGREGLPCRVCGTPIVRIRQGQRSTFYCPRCQRGA